MLLFLLTKLINHEHSAHGVHDVIFMKILQIQPCTIVHYAMRDMRYLSLFLSHYSSLYDPYALLALYLRTFELIPIGHESLTSLLFIFNIAGDIVDV